MAEQQTIALLFVCLGNICRSPMAEAVFVHTISERGLRERFKVDSAGTAGYHIGDPPDYRTVAICKKNGVPIGHYSRKVSKKDFTEFDYILCMDESNLQDLKTAQPKNSKAKVSLFGEFDNKGERIIADPYYGGMDSFEHNFNQVQRCSAGFLKSLGL